MSESTIARVVGPKDGKAGMLGSMGVRFMIDGDESGGGFSLVEHPMPPRALAAPLHRHSREDEYSFVLEGRVGALLGDEVVYGEPGDLIFKPRGQWHTFWNAGDEPARILEIISPAGFEWYFAEMVELLEAGPPDPSALAAVATRHGLEVDRDSFPRLTAEYGLQFGAASRESDPKSERAPQKAAGTLGRDFDAGGRGPWLGSAIEELEDSARPRTQLPRLCSKLRDPPPVAEEGQRSVLPRDGLGHVPVVRDADL